MYTQSVGKDCGRIHAVWMMTHCLTGHQKALGEANLIICHNYLKQTLSCWEQPGGEAVGDIEKSEMSEEFCGCGAQAIDW